METIIQSPSYDTTNPSLSVLIPFYKDDATLLIKALGEQKTEKPFEIQNQNFAVKLISFPQNKGRSAARNHLQNVAQAEWLLFLDADMRPTSPVFLDTYLKAIETHSADVFFGHPFDDKFIGWGWEDSDWAARVSAVCALNHIDNPALHLGLESTDTLLKRFKTSGQNYKRFIDKHPDLAKTLTLYKLSKKLGKVPGQKLMRPILKAVVKSPSPMKARLFALKIWRASWYAEALA